MNDQTLAPETTLAGITITETAAEKLGGVMAQKGLEGEQALRVFVQGGGCGGMQYGMTFDEVRDGDRVFSQHGLKVIVDETSLFYIDGASIDYVDNLMGGGFHIENPQAVSSCGCGSSFRTAQTHTGEEVGEKSCGY
ncbi:MAG: iron-sulfur cluster assembly accessory protein [Caldilineaceae bacterium]|nr:iron-sulfur cluster assembly accessory protein [Caldilineaceae bacterium]